MEYPNRKRGQDHDLYEASYMPDRAPVRWPNEAKLALWIAPIVEFFPLNMDPKPFMPPGGMARIYPDYWNYTLTDYGTRVGTYRVMKAVADRKLTATVAMSSRLAELYPRLADDCLEAGFEIIAHGRDMGHMHGDHLEEGEERSIIEGARDSLSGVLGHPPKGWLSPAMALSSNTTRLVAEAGFEYTCDWINDELPFAFASGAPGLHAMPLGYELSDTRIIEEYKRPPWDYSRQIMDAADFLYAEACKKQSGRLLALPLHPRIIGTPQRISAFEEVLDHILAKGDVWCASGSEILNAWKAQQ